MKELEKARQVFLEECKKSKKKFILLYTIGSIVFVVVIMLMHVSQSYGSLEGLKNPAFYTSEGASSLFNETKIYFYLHIMFWNVVFIILYVIGGKGYSKKGYNIYKKAYKKYIVYDALEKIFTDVKVYDGGLSKEEIAKSGIIKMGTEFYSDDTFKGKYKKVSFEACDVETWHYTYDDEEGSRKVIDFRGQYYIFDFNKKFKGTIKIIPNYKRVINLTNKLKKIKVESSEFNDNYQVFTDDEHLAYYVLTPSFMEKLLKFDTKIYGFSCSFIDNKLYIAISSAKDLFDFDPFEKIDKKKEVKDIKEEVSMVAEIVNDLDLDNDLFK